LTIYYVFGKGFVENEGLLVNNTPIDFNDQGKPVNPVLDEYGIPLTDGYYFVPSIPDGKFDTGTKEYRKYIVKPVPCGYKASDDKKSIIPVTNVAKDNKTLSPNDNTPFWRELKFDEYSKLTSTPIPNYSYSSTNTGETVEPPSGFFKIKTTDSTGNIKYMISKIPMNHKVMNSGNPKKIYLSYTGPYSDIFQYNYSYNVAGKPDNTGEFEMDKPNSILDPGADKYKIRLVEEYNQNDNTPKKVKYVVATIPIGYRRDPNDTSLTNLLEDVTKYDANTVPSESPTPTATTTATPSDATMERGTYYQFDRDGKLVEINYKDSNFAPVLYYMPGAYKFGSSNFVPTYEDSVYLSRTTREAQLLPNANPATGSEIINTDAQLGGFCNANKNDKQKMEEKCNAVEPESCASTTCCVLMGGQKCVSGNENGPYMTANYTDYTLRNKDFYYYQGKCYGNCKKDL